MAEKRQIRRGLKQLQRVKTWQLIIVLVIFGLLSATLLRLNNIGMVERRTAVFQADKSGDDTRTVENLFALQRWSASHMNARTDTFYLEEGYKRAVKKATEEMKQTNNITASIVEQADATCKARHGNYYSSAYVVCFEAEQSKGYESGSQISTSVKLPNPELYRHEYSSPLWSPDFAGWSLLVCALIVVMIITRMISLAVLKLLLRRHYSSI